VAYMRDGVRDQRQAEFIEQLQPFPLIAGKTVGAAWSVRISCELAEMEMV
jgi:hypothetical protein